MAIPGSLLTHLAQLADHLGGDPDQLTPAAVDLVADLEAGVHGYAGLQLTVLHTGHPVTLTLVNPELVQAVITSVRVPLTLLAPRYEHGGRIVLYSTVPGALVDLATDLGYALKPASDTAGEPDRPDGDKGAGLDGDSEGGVALDADLPLPPATTTGLTGWQELATIHRAAGLLIGQGHDPDTVHDTLRRDAQTAGLTVHLFAAHLLQR